ncbi:MAG TPA: alpha/beta fold hydrolase [Acidimicrobiales bacterium]|nr:alpha/beta fold hydrolase [Acidimicrobiales bacterium]
MREATLRRKGRNLRYAVSDNTEAHTRDGTATWAINLHGYFAGGGMYWRESANLAGRLGWRIVNPCIPGFGDSDPLPKEKLSIGAVAEEMSALLDHLGVERAVLIGHSMGAAVAVEMADRHPERTLGIIYRAGVATPAWRQRRGLVARVLSVVSPDLAGATDILVAAVLDVPDLFIGRRPASTFRRLWPDARHNVRAMGGAMAIGSMLMSLDLRDTVARVCDEGIPLLPIWGCFDRITNAATAAEFASLTGESIVWVPGGHSWMLPRPRGLGDILVLLERGQLFMEDVERRLQDLTPQPLAMDARGRALEAG